MLLESIEHWSHESTVIELSNQDVPHEVHAADEKTIIIVPETKPIDISSVQAMVETATKEKTEAICLVIKQLILASQIKDAIYQNKDYSKALEQMISYPNPPEIRKAAANLAGIAAINHPSFSLLLSEFPAVSKNLIINSRMQEDHGFFKNLFYRLLYRVVFLKKISGESSEMEMIVTDLKLALENRDINHASEMISKIQSEDADFLLWKEHFKILSRKLKEINQIILSLSKVENCSK